MANSALAYVNAYGIYNDTNYSSFIAKKQSFFTYRCFAIEYSKNTFQSPIFWTFLLKKRAILDSIKVKIREERGN
jgi:hypothetical protein